MLKNLEKLDTTNASSREFEHAARLRAVGEAEVDLVDDQLAAAGGHRVRDAPHLVVRNHGARRIGRRRDQRAACRGRPVPLDQVRRQLVVGIRTDGDADRRPFEHADEVAIARVAGIGQQDAVVPVHEQRHHQQQRGRRARGDDDALRRHGHAVVVRVVRGDRAPQLGKAERGRVDRRRRRRSRAAPRPRRAAASESPARRSPCGRRCGRPPPAHARRSALPSRGTARSRRRAPRCEQGDPSKVLARFSRQSAIVPPAP